MVMVVVVMVIKVLTVPVVLLPTSSDSGTSFPLLYTSQPLLVKQVVYLSMIGAQRISKILIIVNEYFLTMNYKPFKLAKSRTCTLRIVFCATPFEYAPLI